MSRTNNARQTPPKTGQEQPRFFRIGIGIALCFFLLLIYVHLLSRPKVRVGADILVGKHLALLTGKKVGVITNQTGVLSSGQHFVDALLEHRISVVALFGPEHGIRGDVPDGVSIRDGKDVRTAIPVYSLYGEVRKPTAEMLRGVDALVFDVQTVDARFHTFISTMMLAMEAAAEHGIDFIVLDRPNPTRGLVAEGPVREDSLQSFISHLPIPITSGMTIGELAKMINEEGWLNSGERVSLTVIPMEGWKRSMWYDETELKWVRPSPNMKSLRTAIVYAGSALIEGIANVSEGRGTDRPFEYIGAPWIDGRKLADELNSLSLPGVTFEPIEFTPERVEGRSPPVKYEGNRCHGVSIHVNDRDSFSPVSMGINLLYALKRQYGSRIQWRTWHLDRLVGSSKVRERFDGGASPREIMSLWEEEIEGFMGIRSKYLIYD
ncbi:MAG: exo-beta-N-acetylmuramidase NamZ domain-containing protein [Bacteroidota bacterium]